MPTIKIQKDCEASENGVDLIQFTKGQEVTVSDAMLSLLIDIEGVRKPRGANKATPEDKATTLETPETK